MIPGFSVCITSDKVLMKNLFGSLSSQKDDFSFLQVFPSFFSKYSIYLTVPSRLRDDDIRLIIDVVSLFIASREHVSIGDCYLNVLVTSL